MRFNVVDIETTGLDLANHQIVEIGAVKFDKGKAVEKLNILVKPTCEFSEGALRTNKINPAMLADKPALGSVLHQLTDFCGKDFVIGHNFHRFDINFLNKAFLSHEVDAPKGEVFCSLQLAHKAVRKDSVANYKLLTLIEYFKIPVDPNALHRATTDCLYNGMMALKLMERLKIKSLEDLKLVVNSMKFQQPPAQRSLL